MPMVRIRTSVTKFYEKEIEMTEEEYEKIKKKRDEINWTKKINCINFKKEEPFKFLNNQKILKEENIAHITVAQLEIYKVEDCSIMFKDS